MGQNSWGLQLQVEQLEQRHEQMADVSGGWGWGICKKKKEKKKGGQGRMYKSKKIAKTMTKKKKTNWN
jgi:hypothetical protein